MNFLHVSDLHFLLDPGRAPGIFGDLLRLVEPCLTQLEGLLQQIQEPLQGLVLSGDLVHEGEAEDYRGLRLALETRFPGLPLMAIPGNHDHPGAFQAGWGPTPRMRCERLGDLRLIMLDNSHPDHPDGKVMEEDLDLLAAMLAEEGPTVLVTHHHLLPGQFALPPAVYPERFVEIIRQSRLLAILCGHTHTPFAARFAGIPYYTTGGLCFKGLNSEDGVRFVQEPALNLCHFDGKSFDVRVIPGVLKSLS